MHTHTHARTHAHLFNGPFSGTTLVSRYQKGKSNLDRVAVASVGPYAGLHLAPDRLPCQHPTTQFFADRMPFLPPNQQRQSTVTCDKLRAVITSYLLMLVKVMFYNCICLFVCLLAE